MNLIVAKGIPSLASLDIGNYVAQADEWASDIRQRLPRMEAHFHRAQADWKNDIRFFRLGVVCWYVYEVLKAGTLTKMLIPKTAFIQTRSMSSLAGLWIGGRAVVLTCQCCTLPLGGGWVGR